MLRTHIPFKAIANISQWISALFLMTGTAHNALAFSSNWDRIGPGGGGSTFIPTYSYHSADTFIVRCDMTGSYLTFDGGQSYAQINRKSAAISYAFDPSNSSVIYIGSKSLDRSTDSGRTWTRIFPPEHEITREVYLGDHAGYEIYTVEDSLYFSNHYSMLVHHIQVDPADPTSIFLAFSNDFFFTHDDAATWNKHQFNSRVEWFYTNTTSLSDSVLIFTSTERHLYDKSTQLLHSTPLPSNVSGAFSFTGGTDPISGETVLYALKTVSGGTQTWQSTDLGLNWVQLNNPVLNNQGGSQPSYKSIRTAEYDSRYVYVVASDYRDVQSGASGQRRYGLLKSSDSGQSWEWVHKAGSGLAPSNLTDSWVTSAFGTSFIDYFDVGVHPHYGDYAILTDWYRTIQTTDGGILWNEVYSEMHPDGSVTSRGMDVSTAYGVHIDPFDPDHVSISFTDIGYFHSFNGGNSWVRSIAGIPSNWRNTNYWTVFDPAVQGKAWSVWSSAHDYPKLKMTRSPNWRNNVNGGVATTTNGGQNWTTRTSGIGSNSPSTSIVLDLNSNPDSRTLYLTAYNRGVYKSTDGGITWSQRNNGIETPAHFWRVVLQENGTLYLITTPGPSFPSGQMSRSYFDGALYKSTDGAESWQKLTLPEKLGYPSSITYNSENPDKLYISAWADLELSDFIGLSYANSTGGNEIVEYKGGIWISEDAGLNWRNVFDEESYIYDVTTDPRFPGRLYAVTFTHGAWRSDDYGESWHKILEYDFYWGHRSFPDMRDSEKIFITTFGSSAWHGYPEIQSTPTPEEAFPSAARFGDTNWMYSEELGYFNVEHYPWIYSLNPQ